MKSRSSSFLRPRVIVGTVGGLVILCGLRAYQVGLFDPPPPRSDAFGTTQFDEPPPDVIAAGPGKTYSRLAGLIAWCAGEGHFTKDAAGQLIPILPRKAVIVKNCVPPPEPSATNFFNLRSASQTDAASIVTYYLRLKLVFREQPSDYVVSFVKNSTDPALRTVLEKFSIMQHRIELIDGNPSSPYVDRKPAHYSSSGGGWPYYVEFWQNTLRLPDFSQVDNQFGPSPWDVLLALNVPLFYLLALAILSFPMINIEDSLQPDRRRGVLRFLDRKIAKAWTAIGHRDAWAFYARYARRHHNRGRALAFCLMICLAFFNHQALIMVFIDLALAAAASRLYIRCANYYWDNYYRADAVKRFPPVPRPAPAPSGEHGTASLQGVADLAASGFIDEGKY